MDSTALRRAKFIEESRKMRRHLHDKSKLCKYYRELERKRRDDFNAKMLTFLHIEEGKNRLRAERDRLEAEHEETAQGRPHKLEKREAVAADVEQANNKTEAERKFFTGLAVFAKAQQRIQQKVEAGRDEQLQYIRKRNEKLIQNLGLLSTGGDPVASEESNKENVQANGTQQVQAADLSEHQNQNQNNLEQIFVEKEQTQELQSRTHFPESICNFCDEPKQMDPNDMACSSCLHRITSVDDMLAAFECNLGAGETHLLTLPRPSVDRKPAEKCHDDDPMKDIQLKTLEPLKLDIVRRDDINWVYALHIQLPKMKSGPLQPSQRIQQSRPRSMGQQVQSRPTKYPSNHSQTPPPRLPTSAPKRLPIPAKLLPLAPPTSKLKPQLRPTSIPSVRPQLKSSNLLNPPKSGLNQSRPPAAPKSFTKSVSKPKLSSRPPIKSQYPVSNAPKSWSQQPLKRPISPPSRAKFASRLPPKLLGGHPPPPRTFNHQPSSKLSYPLSSTLKVGTKFNDSFKLKPNVTFIEEPSVKIISTSNFLINSKANAKATGRPSTNKINYIGNGKLVH